MAVVKKKNVEAKEEKVVTTPEVEVDTTVVKTDEVPVGEEVKTEEELDLEHEHATKEEEIPVVEKEEEETPVVEKEEEKQPEVEVDTTVVEEETPVVEKTVRIKPKVDHRCNIGGELYDLKAGKCYNVPMAVKYILNNAGILAPL